MRGGGDHGWGLRIELGGKQHGSHDQPIRSHRVTSQLKEFPNLGWRSFLRGEARPLLWAHVMHHAHRESEVESVVVIRKPQAIKVPVADGGELAPRHFEARLRDIRDVVPGSGSVHIPRPVPALLRPIGVRAAHRLLEHPVRDGRSAPPYD